MIYDWQERTAMLMGEEMLEHFRNSTVAVIGVGGVGGYAAEMIVRAGVGHLIQTFFCHILYHDICLFGFTLNGHHRAILASV